MLNPIDISSFIDKIIEKLEQLGINTATLTIDHLGYQADSKADYDAKTNHIHEFAIKVSENIVGGRRVGIFRLNELLEYKTQNIGVVEVFEPKEGQTVKSDWEHIEFLVAESLEDFVKRYKELNWNTEMMSREEFPQLILSLGEGLRAKFPRLGVLDEIKRVNYS